jgi:large conductance mechanosensitive channel
VIVYDGVDTAIGLILDVLLNSLIVGWALFIIIKVNIPTQHTIESGVNMIRESVNPMQVIDGD